MTSVNNISKICATCRKGGDVFMCRGCRQTFCAKHVDEHRKKLSKEVDKLAEEHELLGRNMIRDSEVQLLVSIIDTWEQESIARINLAAETARTDLQKWTDRNNIEVKIPFERITNEVRSCQQADDYTETDLKRWIQQLEEYRNKMEKLPILDLIDDEGDTENIRLIKLKENHEESKEFGSTTNNSQYTFEQSMISFQEPTLLVRERFDDVNGIATVSEDGLLATYSGPWLGHSGICGINLYSSGTHHIRFRLLEKFYDPPFFGIITASQTNMEKVLESISTNGWWNLDLPIRNGEKDHRIPKDKIIRSYDELTLTVDCERKQIFLKHHRSRRLAHLPIDIRACPFPWKILVVLHRRGDAVRIIGGTLTLTRENLISRLSQKRNV
ncbi:unnamed protein product [Adineta steineri]|uniref:B box-type domain-containing protein n=1 Tax=Adineta steineri TaxID=433720 RepID=A0A814Y7J6_9BILA|nr:unnamed protein product [Adineta steineri]